jgi:hypothetical protein
MEKVKTKTFLAQVVIKSKNPDKLPDFGIGTGVLFEREIVYSDTKNLGWKNPLMVVAQMRAEEDMIKEVVEVKWTEIKPKGKKR